MESVRSLGTCTCTGVLMRAFGWKDVSSEWHAASLPTAEELKKKKKVFRASAPLSSFSSETGGRGGAMGAGLGAGQTPGGQLWFAAYQKKMGALGPPVMQTRSRKRNTHQEGAIPFL